MLPFATPDTDLVRRIGLALNPTYFMQTFEDALTHHSSRTEEDKDALRRTPFNPAEKRAPEQGGDPPGKRPRGRKADAGG